MYEGPIVTPVGEGDVQGGSAGSPMSFRTSGRGKAGRSCTAGETEAQRGGARPWALPGVGGCSRHLPHHPESFPWASAPREGARRKADTPLGPPEPRGPDRPQLGAVSRTPHEPVRVRVRIPCQSPGHSQPDSVVLPSAEGRIRGQAWTRCPAPAWTRREAPGCLGSASCWPRDFRRFPSGLFLLWKLVGF